MAPSAAQLWTNLESEAWTSMRAGRRVRSAPVKTIRKIWSAIALADRTALAPRIQSFRNQQTALTDARSNLLDAPMTFDNNVANAEYVASVQALEDALTDTVVSAGQLHTLRAQHPDPYNTLGFLQKIRDTHMEEAAGLWMQYSDYGRDWKAHEAAVWTAAHPGGTPPPSPPAGPPPAFRVPPAPTDAWVGGFPLGAGGQARPVVYVRQNRHGQIIDRVCIKDTAWPYRDAEGPIAASEIPVLWDPDFAVGAATHEGKRPSEIGALTRLDAIGDTGSIALRNWKKIYQANQLRWYRTYTEWCGYGDLYSLSRKYTPYADRRGEPRPEDSNEEEWLPEAWVWFCFETLALTGTALSYGNLDAPSESWSEIIHNDLKPQNVFIGTNTSNLYAGYPTPKIGDWGLATILSEDPTRRLGPAHYLNLGTAGCDAPEQKDFLEGEASISERTNIWGIGLVLWAMLHSCQYGRNIYHDTPPFAHRISRYPVQFSHDHRMQYSNQLLSLISDCLQLAPSDRPDFVSLLERIQDVTDVDDSLRRAAASDPRFLDDQHAIKLGDEAWSLKSTLARQWSEAPKPAKPPITDAVEIDENLLGGAAGGRIDEA